RTRTVTPVKSELLKPHVIPTSSIIQASVKKKQQKKRYHDKKAKPLPALVVGDSIRAKIRPHMFLIQNMRIVNAYELAAGNDQSNVSFDRGKMGKHLV
ncbi:hypothetical protein pdam_00019425, partial [Pocillopora damicornis]